MVIKLQMLIKLQKDKRRCGVQIPEAFAPNIEEYITAAGSRDNCTIVHV